VIPYSAGHSPSLPTSIPPVAQSIRRLDRRALDAHNVFQVLAHPSTLPRPLLERARRFLVSSLRARPALGCSDNLSPTNLVSTPANARSFHKPGLHVLVARSASRTAVRLVRSPRPRPGFAQSLLLAFPRPVRQARHSKPELSRTRLARILATARSIYEAWRHVTDARGVVQLRRAFELAGKKLVSAA
jgi:hypothetical protein